MTGKHLVHRAPGALPAAPGLARVAWPIVKRLPAYIRLGWALGKEPSIPPRHRALLVSAALYAVSPAQMVVGMVPIVGQVDSVLLFLVGLRHALRHCPKPIAEKHLARLGLSPTQLDDDLAAIRKAAGRTLRAAGRRIGRELRFAGRVARGFGGRVLARMASLED